MSLLASQRAACPTGSLGISFGTGGFGVSASASSARGKEAGDDLVHTNTHITAGNKVNISGTSVSVGGGTDGQKKGMSGVGVGVGSDSGSASSTTTAGISGIAGDTAIRSTDAESGVARIFEKERVQKEIEAQTKITEMFGREASKAIGDYAATQMKQAGSLRAQAHAETDPDKQAALNAQADQLEADWGDNGKLRLLAHTVVGGLTGGASGALGAATGTLAAPAVADALADAGIDGALATTLTAIASTAVGVAAGGTAGGAAALNEVANNYLKHADVEKLSKQLKSCGVDKACRDQAFEEAYRTSVANDIALLNCKSTANCDALKAEYRKGYEAIGQMLDAGISPDDVGLVLNMETNAQTIIRHGLDQMQCSTAACKDKANHLVGIGKGLAKITPAGLVTGSGVMAYELTTALLNIGLADTAVAVAKGLADLPADIRNRLDSSDPQVRGEALVDALAIGTVATAMTAKMGQLGYTGVVRLVEAKAAKAAESETIAKAKVENNLTKDGGIADPAKGMSPSGAWKPASQLTGREADGMIEQRLPQGMVTETTTANRANAEVLAEDSRFKPPYVPDTKIVTVKTAQPETFVRVYVQDPNKSDLAGSWMMRADDINGLTPEQIASKYALPQVPTHIADVTVPAGNTLRVSVANDVQIKQGLGGNGGGGGVQFEVVNSRSIPEAEFKSWFSNPRAIR